MPRHKGKVESGVKYVQGNALKARKFSSLAEENDHLGRWEASVADTRIHGTTRQHVGRVFQESERPVLQPLPRERFLQGLLSLTQRYPTETLEKACETALSHGVFHLRTLRTLMARQAPRQTTLPFLEDHPIIRPLADYAGVVAAALARKDACGVRLERHARTEACSGVTQHKGPEGTVVPQGRAETLPSSGYPSSGCSPAEPDSVSPDGSSVITPYPEFHKKRENLFHE